MHVLSDAGDCQSLAVCANESRLSHHQEQTSSNTCCLFVHQHIQHQHTNSQISLRSHKQSDQPPSNHVYSLWGLYVPLLLASILQEMFYGVRVQGKDLLQWRGWTVGLTQKHSPCKVQSLSLSAFSLSMDISLHSSHVGDLLNCDPVENVSQEMKQPPGDKVEIKDCGSKVSSEGFHNALEEKKNIWRVKQKTFFLGRAVYKNSGCTLNDFDPSLNFAPACIDHP